MLSLVDTKHPGIARPTLRSVRTLVALAHTIHNEVSTPLVALEAAGALRVRVRGCAAPVRACSVVGVHTACGRTLCTAYRLCVSCPVRSRFAKPTERVARDD